MPQHSSKPGMQRWLLPYADLLTVLFVAVLAIKVTPVDTPQMLAKAEPVQAKTQAIKTTSPNKRVLKPLSAQLKQTLTRWHAKTTPAGEITLTLPQTVLFASNDYQLTPQGIKHLDSLKPLLSKTHGRIRVEGHTDNQPPAKPLTNRQLSALRASVVVDTLVDRLGLSGNKLVAIGQSDTYPVENNHTAAGRQSNRRVVIIIEPHKR